MDYARGYYRFPSISQKYIIFVAENDLWRVPCSGGVAQRITNTPGLISHPKISSDGHWVAYSAADEGTPDVYILPIEGGEAKRLTFQPTACTVVGWHPHNEIVYFRSNLSGAHPREQEIYAFEIEGGQYKKLPLGELSNLSFADDGAHCVLQKGYQDPAIWKGYEGGRCGSIWYGSMEDMSFQPLSTPQVADILPFLFQNRIYFLSDREAACNLYSYDLSGKDLQQHTFHRDYYMRWMDHSQEKVVYQMAGDIYIYDLLAKTDTKVDISLQSCGTTLRSRFVSPSRYLNGYALSPKNDEMVITTRGSMFLFPSWKGAVRRMGNGSHARYRLVRWLPCGTKIVAVTDESGEEQVVLYESKTGKRLKNYNLREQGGHIQQLLPAPKGDLLAAVVQSELHLLNMETEENVFVDEANSRYFREISWSPDGKWLVYSKYEDTFASLFLYNSEDKEIFRLTYPGAHDYSPCFDPKGRYLYFLSKRSLNPYADSLQLDYNFPATTKPYLITLQKDSYSPLSVMSSLQREENKDEDKKSSEKNGESKDSETKDSESKDSESKDSESKDQTKEEACQIDLEGICDRIQEVPLTEGRYSKLIALEDKIIVLKRPVQGQLSEPSIWEDPDRANKQLIAYDVKEQKEETLCDKVTNYEYRGLGKEMILQVGKKLRVVKVGEKVSKNSSEDYSKKSGWVKLSRVRVQVNPFEEWKQMFRDAWRWHRDFFWTSDMKGKDWLKVREKYEPLLERIRTRSELSDILWEVNGELGTSHAYVLMEEAPLISRHHVGLLGVDWELDEEKGLFRIAKIHKGDVAHCRKHSPLVEPGLNIAPGSYLLEINGVSVVSPCHPNEHLLNQANAEVLLKFSPTGEEEEAQEVTVTTLVSELPIRYQEWVEANRKIVSEKTGNRVGYLHVPDMGMAGMIAFHRDFLWQYQKDGLIVDVRHNGGGHISSILLSRLQRKALGYCKPRRGQVEMYPRQTMRGPIVVLCDEHTGSDGDIFCQAFKMMKMGTMIGKRTWGGVVGIMPDKRLVDNGIVTQPEFAFWFEEEGWQVENQGVAPHIEVENDPASVARGEDRQLEKGIEEILQQMEGLDLSMPQL